MKFQNRIQYAQHFEGESEETKKIGFVLVPPWFSLAQNQGTFTTKLIYYDLLCGRAHMNKMVMKWHSIGSSIANVIHYSKDMCTQVTNDK